MRSMVLSVTLMMLTLGCIGGTPEEDSDAPNNETNTTPNNTTFPSDPPEPSNNTSTNETNDTAMDDNGTALFEPEPTEERQWDNRSGEVSGLGLVILAPEGSEELSLEDGTLELALDISSEGGELDICVLSPSDEENCAAELSTAEGNATWTATNPENGTWTIEMTATGLGLQAVAYNATISYVVVEAA